ncbi:Flowering-promoting factor 1-like protein 1, partial [Mucuna pruriens]
MSGVWVFDKNGVARLITNPTRESFEQKEPRRPGTATAPGARPRVLVYLPSNQVIRSYAELEHRLTELGWTRYRDSVHSNLIQFHRSDASSHLISLPKHFANFKHFHFYDIVVKNRSFFQRESIVAWMVIELAKVRGEGRERVGPTLEHHLFFYINCI